MVERIGISVESDLLKRFDAWMDAHGYTNRSEAVRDLMRSTMLAEDWTAGKGDVTGVLVLVYEHHYSDLSHRLDHLQHEHHGSIIGSFHVHLDEENCLEVILLRGKGTEVKSIGEKLATLKGVKYGKLVPAVTDRLL